MTVSDDILTPEEKEAIHELKERVLKDLEEKLYDNDAMFLRFLRARDYNLNDAEIMLRNYLQWRKKINIDYVVNEYKPLEVLEKYYAYNFIGFDRGGSIIRYIPMGNFDTRGLRMSTKESDWEKRLVKMMELDEKLTKEHNKDKFLIPGYFFIFDMKNVSLAAATDKKAIELIIKMSNLFQAYYPERLRRLFFINGSTFFNFAYGIVKKFLAPNIMRKISVYGADGYKEDLLKFVDADVLPAFLGGERTDPDGNPNCLKSISFCGPVPEKYYFKKKNKPLSHDPKAKKLTLSRASFSEITVTVKVPESLLEWEFETKSKDVAFGLFFKEEGAENDEITELMPIVRFDAEFQETGMYKCEKPGIYVLLFDNSYSWIRSKEIFYKTTIVSPKEHEAQLEN